MKIHPMTPNFLMILIRIVFFLTWVMTKLVQFLLTIFSCFVIWPFMLYGEKNKLKEENGVDIWYTWRPLILSRFTEGEWPIMYWLVYVNRKRIRRTTFLGDGGPVDDYAYEYSPVGSKS